MTTNHIAYHHPRSWFGWIRAFFVAFAMVAATMTGLASSAYADRLSLPNRDP